MKKRAAAHKLRTPGWEALPRWTVSVNMMSTWISLTEPTEIDAAFAGNLTSVNILLDSASDQCILNHYHRHLFHNLKALNGTETLSEIGGATDIEITDLGTVTFMGSKIHNVY